MEWKFKKDIEPVGSSNGFWYDLLEGYIRPEEIIDDEMQLSQVKHAIDLLENFRATIELEGILEEFQNE